MNLIDLRYIDNLKDLDLDTVDTSKPAPEFEPNRQFYFMAKARSWVKKKSEELGRPMTFFTQTFGCQMNARDSEKLSGILEQIGYIPKETEDADFVIYNTCTVRENANLKVYGRLGALSNKKKKNPEMLIALCGCMMQEELVVDKLKKSYRFVDLIFGTYNVYKFAELIYMRLCNSEMIIDIWDKADQIVEELPTERKYPFKSGVNIMFGCNNFCSYCIVPYVRGRERSREPEQIIREIRELVADGVVEVMLLGQNVNSYGKNLETPVTFAELLKQVEEIEGLKRIRFMTSHPKDLSDDLIEVMKNSKKICSQLHLPVQSGSSRILKEMNRHYTKESYLALVDRIRTAMPDISLTTDIIVGFPGETEEDFEDTLDVVRKVGFEQVFMFIYSRRVGTPGDKMPNQVPEDVKHKRFDRLKELVESQIAENNKEYLGTVQKVLVEGPSKNNDKMLTGRTESSKIVVFDGKEDLINTIQNVKITEDHMWYFKGEKE